MPKLVPFVDPTEARNSDTGFRDRPRPAHPPRRTRWPLPSDPLRQEAHLPSHTPVSTLPSFGRLLSGGGRLTRGPTRTTSSARIMQDSSVQQSSPSPPPNLVAERWISAR